MSRFVNQDEVDCDEEERIAETIVGAGFCDDNVADVERDVFLCKATFLLADVLAEPG